MKTGKITTVLSIIVGLSLVGCASSRRSVATREKPSPVETGRSYEKAPFTGMTKGQALARYGKPRRRVLTEEGERWYYVLNAGEVVRKTLNPLVLTPPRYRSGVLVFGSDDRLKRFAWESKN